MISDISSGSGDTGTLSGEDNVFNVTGYDSPDNVGDTNYIEDTIIKAKDKVPNYLEGNESAEETLQETQNPENNNTTNETVGSGIIPSGLMSGWKGIKWVILGFVSLIAILGAIGMEG
jgi:hypothetical protein